MRRRRAGLKGIAVSRFTETMFANAQWSVKGMVTGEPHAPIRHTWIEVHERARQIAGGLAAAGVGHGDAVAVLAGAPVEIAPTAQGIWMRGASLTMLHQPTPRTDLQRWALDTTAVIDMVDAKAVVVSDPFMPAAPLLSQLGMRVLTIEQLLDGRAHPPGRHRRRRRGVPAVDLGLDRVSQGRSDHARKLRRQRRGDVRRRERRRGLRRDRELAALFSRHGHDRLPHRADVLRRRTRQDHADGLPARYVVVGQAD